ncbi:glycosyltransferase family 2 protein [Leisingera sp. JC1]|uniref:glycosyltransferase family 2 protein n=1 Tax=Leisingera sp. JC1 TaxID=1855282 RepID=UPI000802EEEB|nr:hypothetical protein [Leisingera sp. JC1]OBY24281.1 hypothetical protein A9D60_09810 [Leisingera sp. JC1]
MKVCILIPTYKRHASLLRLLHQIGEYKSTYRGDLSFEICVTDSEPGNPRRREIEALCDSYLVNPGDGFDSNMHSAYQRVSQTCDFVLSISDDDLFAKGFAHPFDLLEVAARQNQDAILFDHLELRSEAAPQNYNLKEGPYNRVSFLEPDSALFHKVMLFYIPRHAGLFYKSTHLQKIHGKLEAFIGSLHLYAVPFQLAWQKGTAHYFGYPLVYFNADEKEDGAWSAHRAVFDGLVQYFGACKHIMPSARYEAMKPGFMRFYLGDNSMMRASIKGQLPSETEVMAALAET